jgi:hypothetical protein
MYATYPLHTSHRHANAPFHIGESGWGIATDDALINIQARQANDA